MRSTLQQAPMSRISAIRSSGSSYNKGRAQCRVWKPLSWRCRSCSVLSETCPTSESTYRSESEAKTGKKGGREQEREIERYVHLYIYIYIYTHAHIHTSIYIHKNTCVYVYVYVYIYRDANVYIYIERERGSEAGQGSALVARWLLVTPQGPRHRPLRLQGLPKALSSGIVLKIIWL